MTATLTVQPWPAWAAVGEAGFAQWAQAVASLRARSAVASAGEVDLAWVARWAAALRQAGRVAVLRAAPEVVCETWVRAIDGAPLVLALRPTPTTRRGHWQRAVATLAGWRSPWLRLAAWQMPWCAHASGDVPADVALDWPVASSAGDDRCLGCAAVGRCPGPGNRRFSPRPRAAPISNQFDLVPATTKDSVIVRVDGEPPLRVSEGSAHAHAVARALAKGQLYRDRSDQALVDDFAAQLQPLRRNRDGCWVPRKVAPFAAEEARLVALLAGLRGVIVDVGAGPLRYVSALNAALQAEQLRYVAVEPDLDHLRAGQAAVPRGLFVRGVGEALPLGDATADAVLFLRSWNHLSDVGAAVREASRVVRPGGVMVAVDNELFGLVRSADRLARARAIDTDRTPFEHYRNASLGEAWAAIVRAAPGQWRKQQAWPVGAATSNQWQLVAERLAG